MWTTGAAELYSTDGKSIGKWVGTITNVVNFDNGITTFSHNFNNKVTVRNGIVVIVESQYKFDDESELDYPP